MAAEETFSVAEQFEDLEQQAHAARLGMWVFLGSEALLFLGLFALYVGYRVEHPQGFGQGIEHNTYVLGTLNTFVLLCSSYAVASALHALRGGHATLAFWLTGLTVALGALFLVIKFVEYGKHFHDGIYPGGAGHFFDEHSSYGLIQFFTLYFVTTGLHAIHVFVGMLVLTFMAIRIARKSLTPLAPHPLELGAIYWHLVDVIWIFVWPLYYLLPGQVR